jgi:L-ascorbate metabolism protein UlaG (beta-lactamase superfamily)
MKTASPKGIPITWFGHSAFRIVSPGGKVVLIDPWLDNPKAPPGAKDIRKADLILVTHGHSDHLGNTVEIAKRTGAAVLAIHEIALYLERNGVTTARGMNKGGTTVVGDISVTMVDARHSSEIDGGEGGHVSGGEAAGFVIRFEDGSSIYHAGDTSVFGDMRIIAELYRPHVAILPIGGLYTMDVREAAYAAKLLKPDFIIGMHYGTFPVLTGTPGELKKLLPPALRNRVIELVPGTPGVLIIKKASGRRRRR